MSQSQYNPTTTTAAATPATGATAAATPEVAPAVLENLAARFRPAGLFLLMLRPDGSVAYHDPAAGTFFTRYILPMLQYPEQTDTGIGGKAQVLNASSAVSIW